MHTRSNTRKYVTCSTYPTWKGLSMDIIDDSGKIITIYNIYRSSKNNNSHASFYTFLQEFSPVIRNLSRYSKNVALTGNFNIDLLKFNSNIKCQECYYSLAEFDRLPVVTLPTRMSKRNATLMDHMHCKSPNPLTISEN